LNIDADRITRYFEELNGKITLGIVDGCIDEVWQVVDARISKNEYTVFNKMKQFAERIIRCGEGGMGNEVVRKRRSYGGFTANTGNATARLGVDTVMLGMYGKERIDPVFKEFERMCTLISFGEPALTNIYEFDDGKIMLPYVQEIVNFDWDMLVSALGMDKLRTIFSESDIIAIGYWSGTPAFDEIVTKICENLLEGGKSRRMFFDFADIKKRDKKSLTDTLHTLRGLNCVIPMTLSLNEHEAADVFAHLGEAFAMESDQVCETIENVRQKTGLDEIVVHTPYFAAAASCMEGVAVVPQDYCSSPVRTTGAGDTFNGGYMSARLEDLSIAERLAVANCAAGFFIRNGYAPDRVDIVNEVKRYITRVQQHYFPPSGVV